MGQTYELLNLQAFNFRQLAWVQNHHLDLMEQSKLRSEVKYIKVKLDQHF